MSNWLKCALIRAVRTMAQTCIAMIGTAVVLSDVDWKYVISAVILSGILAMLTAVAGLPEVDEEEVAEFETEVDDLGEEEVETRFNIERR